MIARDGEDSGWLSKALSIFLLIPGLVVLAHRRCVVE